MRKLHCLNFYRSGRRQHKSQITIHHHYHHKKDAFMFLFFSSSSYLFRVLFKKIFFSANIALQRFRFIQILDSLLRMTYFLFLYLFRMSILFATGVVSLSSFFLLFSISSITFVIMMQY